jgi:hypothetical protein
MNAVIVEELLKMRTWLQEALLRNEQDKQQLTTFLSTIDTLLGSQPRAEAEHTPQVTIAEVKRVFDDELLKVLEITQEDPVIVIRRKQFLERDVWLTVNAKVDELNGHWISAGEDSRWEIPIAS